MRKSISDWKNIYSEECEECCAKSDCGGFFASATRKYPANIKAFLNESAFSQCIAGSIPAGRNDYVAEANS